MSDPRIFTRKQSLQLAVEHMIKRNSNLIRPIVTPYPYLNQLFWESPGHEGGFEPGWIVSLSGRSGCGKTTMLRHIKNDVHRLNPFTNIYCLDFNLEMPAQRLGAKEISEKSGKSLKDLHVNMKDKDLRKIREGVDGMKETPSFIVEGANTVDQIITFTNKFTKAHNIDGENKGLLLSLDHALLLQDSGNINDILRGLGNELNNIKYNIKYFVGIIVNQLNDNIEDISRRSADYTKCYEHFPKRTDIYGNRGIFNVSDVVMVLHDPYDMGILAYGPRRWETKGKLFLHILKLRDEKKQVIAFRNELHLNRLGSLDIKAI